ncbi:hypothetical protein OsI_12772 [Oryza sativa Indica Group]|uniref:non-specific serine/threonine protein kinase n=1 Tax=Oryza sativa subsp. indica TaxID=39946 RepID=A2XK03_ORYSI|nr:hypothetical protein OsI_12772 [Oryza sativa Indica Group]
MAAAAASPTSSSSLPPKPPNSAAMLVEQQPLSYHDVDAASTPSSSVSSSSTASVGGRSSTFSLDSAATATPTSSPPRPHRAADVAWAPIRAAAAPFGPRAFTLVRRVGAGDIGTVYLCRLDGKRGAGSPSPCEYAMKAHRAEEEAQGRPNGQVRSGQAVGLQSTDKSQPTTVRKTNSGPENVRPS